MKFGWKTTETKNIFVLGAGKVGYEVAKRLADRGQHVKVIDRDEKHCQEVSQKLEHSLVLCADSTDVETLKNEGIAKADAFIAVTDNDNTNILSSLLAKRLGVKRAITLVNQPELMLLANSLGIDACVNPRLSTASAIFKYVRRGNVLSVVHQGHAEVLELQLPSKSELAGKEIGSIHLPEGVIIGGIVREEEVIIPGGDTLLFANDQVIVFTLAKSVPKVEEFFS